MLTRKNINFRTCSVYTLYNHVNFCTQTLSEPTVNDSSIVRCNTQISKHGRNGNIEASESIFNRMSRKTTVTYTAMLTAFAQNGQVVRARKLFDEMPHRNVASYNAMITAYVKHSRMVDEAFRLFSRMEERNEVSYGAMITGFFAAGMFERAEQLYSEMPVKWRDSISSNVMISGYLKAGRLDEAVQVFEGMVNRDVVSWSCMIDGYCKRGRIFEARALFDRMPERNVVTWTAMIDGYMNFECFEDGFGLFLIMRREGVVAVNPNTLTVILEACGHFGRYKEGMQVHGLVLQMGFELDVFLGNSIITMYCRFGCMDEANTVFQMMRKKDVVSWNSLIAGYIQSDDVGNAFKFFEEMSRKDVVSWTTMIAGFSSKGNVEKAVKLFKMMPEKDDVAWTAVISGFVGNEEHEEAFRWFVEMLKKGVKPNSLTFSSMLSASAGLAELKQGLQIHAHVVKMNIGSELSIQNSLISMYSKCGKVAEAYEIFRNTKAPNVISYNSIITGFGQNGLGQEALELFRAMKNEKLKPNEITFLGVLSACSHVGLVEEGLQYFNSMKSAYDIEPGPDHYACIVDLLGRADLLDEAFNLINSMPVEPHSGVWGALLGASRKHGRLDLAKLAAQQLTKLEPHSATPYVVLSDLYSISGKLKDSDKVRMMKKSKKINKIPGCSWIK